MADPASLPNYRLTAHAIIEMGRRKIEEAHVQQVLFTPEQLIRIRPGRNIYQPRMELGDPPKTYLIRVFVDIDRDPPEVVTAYRTGKVEKYWRVDS